MKDSYPQVDSDWPAAWSSSASIEAMRDQLVELYDSYCVAMGPLVLRPDFASHYGPHSVLADAASSEGHRGVVATGSNLRDRVEVHGFEWRSLQLGTGSNSGVAECDESLQRFITATVEGPLARMRRQALDREQDLLFEPERGGRRGPTLMSSSPTECSSTMCRLRRHCPCTPLVDRSYRSFLVIPASSGSAPSDTEALRSGRSRSGPDLRQLAELNHLVDRVTGAFTAWWNASLAAVAPAGRRTRTHFVRVATDSPRRSTSGLRGARHVPVLLPRRAGPDHR